MTATEYLSYLVREIHTVVAATTDENGLPATAAIDMMAADENGLYFLTAKGKRFYERLTRTGYLALTGIKGAATMHRVAVSMRGRVREAGVGLLPRFMADYPYMFEIYPSEASRRALTVFCLYAGAGEWFDLSKKPIERVSFSFGGEADRSAEYRITDRCIGCGSCASVCPQACIDLSRTPAAIRPQNCLHCGNCFDICPVGAVERG